MRTEIERTRHSTFNGPNGGSCGDNGGNGGRGGCQDQAVFNGGRINGRDQHYYNNRANGNWDAEAAYTLNPRNGRNPRVEEALRQQGIPFNVYRDESGTIRYETPRTHHNDGNHGGWTDSDYNRPRRTGGYQPWNHSSNDMWHSGNIWRTPDFNPNARRPVWDDRNGWDNGWQGNGNWDNGWGGGINGRRNDSWNGGWGGSRNGHHHGGWGNDGNWNMRNRDGVTFGIGRDGQPFGGFSTNGFSIVFGSGGVGIRHNDGWNNGGYRNGGWDNGGWNNNGGWNHGGWDGGSNGGWNGRRNPGWNPNHGWQNQGNWNHDQGNWNHHQGNWNHNHGGQEDVWLRNRNGQVVVDREGRPVVRPDIEQRWEDQQRLGYNPENVYHQQEMRRLEELRRQEEYRRMGGWPHGGATRIDGRRNGNNIGGVVERVIFDAISGGNNGWNPNGGCFGNGGWSNGGWDNGSGCGSRGGRWDGYRQGNGGWNNGGWNNGGWNNGGYRNGGYRNGGWGGHHQEGVGIGLGIDQNGKLRLNGIRATLGF
jgi:hypothetical protein